MSKFCSIFFSIIISVFGVACSNSNNTESTIVKIKQYIETNNSDSLKNLHDSIKNDANLCESIIKQTKDSSELIHSATIAIATTPQKAAQITIDELLSMSPDNRSNAISLVKNINKWCNMLYENGSYTKSLDSIANRLDFEKQVQLYTLVSDPKDLAYKVKHETNKQELIKAIEKQYNNNNESLAEFHNALK